ncbi:glycosyltransferase [Pedobacter foliorum]|uniref:glycosyltransferase n=1 Tax=Pedobacter foliorum TaxID=2739058 RepID=UPI0015645AA6|nr:glycosyltransferase [Pedobacter foliorum]NRF39158.1 glycosyltransferase [Pedobacter foliorum]
MYSPILPLVSIVFTSYNHKEFLEQALDSLISQTYPNIEIIIIDDFSTDGSQEILKRYEHHVNVHLNLSTKNSGSYVKASNLGASLAKGEYLLFAQCDDFAEPNQVDRLMAPLLKYEDIGVSFCRSNMIDENGTVLGTDFDVREIAFKKAFSSDNRILGKQMRTFLSKSCVIPNLSAAIIRKALYEKVGRLSAKYLVVADWAFWLALSENCDFYYTTTLLNNFRQHNTTIRSTIKIKKQILELYEVFYNHIKEYEISGKERKEFEIGAGAIFLSYFNEGKVAWLKGFPSTVKETSKFTKFNIWYLFLGFIYKMRSFLARRL